MFGISPYSFVMWAPLYDLEDEAVSIILTKKFFKIMIDEEKDGLVNGPCFRSND